MRLEAQGLVKQFGDAFTLSIPELVVEDGAAFGLVGNNGAGKTTFLRLALDLLRPDEGHVALGGARVADSSGWKKRTSAHLGASFLIDFLTPDEFFGFVGSTYNLSPGEVEQRLDSYRSFFTDDVLGPDARYIRDLSTGNAKKVGVVAALLPRPELLVLDEPFANLDPRSQIQLKDLLRRRRTEHGTTMVISSHDLLHVTDVCERIAVLDEGCIARDEPTTPETLDTLEAYFAGEDRAAAPSSVETATSSGNGSARPA
ncbi:MAG: ABC transporter ATP-binding protein [Bacteroidetes bacterium QS_9_68_14]|nr:MAG: ABC transporter ATP-binding protein [Bacteroidetes bacterium QS_9_68_14]